jgi:methyl-accepting chemotaxis protein
MTMAEDEENKVDSEDDEVTEVEGTADIGDVNEGEDAESDSPEGQDDDGAQSFDKYQEDLADVLGYAKQISGRLEVLVPSLLDTADATNSAADVSRRASLTLEKGLNQVQKRVQELDEASAKSNQLSGYILIGAVTILVLSVGVFGFMAQQLSSKTTQIDAMLVALSKRVVNMNSALSLFDEINSTMNNLAIEQASFSDAQMSLIESVKNAERLAGAIKSDVPEAAAKRVSTETAKVVKDIKSLRNDVSKVSKSVSDLSSRVKTQANNLKKMQGQVGNIKALNADVQSLITLERAKYLDVLRRQVALEESRELGEEPDEENIPSVVSYPPMPTQ